MNRKQVFIGCFVVVALVAVVSVFGADAAPTDYDIEVTNAAIVDGNVEYGQVYNPTLCAGHDYQGEGTTENPYELHNQQDWYCMEEDLDAAYELEDTLFVDTRLGVEMQLNDDWTIERKESKFTGELHGKNRAILFPEKLIPRINSISQDAVVERVYFISLRN